MKATIANRQRHGSARRRSRIDQRLEHLRRNVLVEVHVSIVLLVEFDAKAEQVQEDYFVERQEDEGQPNDSSVSCDAVHHDRWTWAVDERHVSLVP